MDHRQARKTGWTIIGCGCVFIILTKLWVGLAMAALGLLLGGQVLGVGVGTLASMLLTGRVIAGINRAFRQPMRRLAGLEPAGTGEPSAL